MNCLDNPARLGNAVRGLALFSVLAASAAHAAAPKISRLSVYGVQTRATTRIVVQGSDLLPEPRLLLDVPVASQQVHGTPKPNSVEFDITLGNGVTPGVYNLRLSTPEGITSPEIVAIDHLPQRPAVAKRVQQLPVAIHGLAAGSTVQETQFAGHKGQRITIDVLARRLGSKLRPVVHLHDSRGKQVAWSLPQTALAGDARITAQLDHDDTYTVAVHDLAFAGPSQSSYRLAIGDFDYVDQVYPPVVSRNASVTLDLIGKFGGESTAKIDASTAAALLQVNDDAVGGEGLALPWPVGATPVGLRPRVLFSTLPELAEGRTLDPSRQLPAPPVAVSGCLAEAGEEDIYHVDVVEGQRLRIEVFAERIGSPVDATLELRNSQGARLAQSDDMIGAEPRLDYTVAQGVTRLTIAVADAYRRGDAKSIYRVVVSRLDAAVLTSDFKLTVFEDTHHVAANGTKVFRIEADRSSYEGPIRVSIDGLPPGFTASAVEIPAGLNGALVEIRRPNESPAPEASAGLSGGRLVIRGESVDSNSPMVRTAGIDNHPLANLQPWLAHDIVVVPTTTKQSIAASWNEDPANSRLLFGVDSKLPLRFHRAPGTVGPLRLSLLTSQVPILAIGRPVPAQTIRSSTPTIDIPVDANARTAFTALTQAESALAALVQKRPVSGDADPKLVEQVETATQKRDDAARQLREAESKVADTYDFTVLVPAGLRAGEYDLAVRVELRSVDNQSILAEAFTPPRRFHAQPPLELFAAARDDQPIMLDPKSGAIVAIEGTVKRLGGFAGTVTLTLTGLPSGIAAPRVVVKPAEDKYRIEFKLPPTFAAERIESLRIAATLAVDAKKAGVTANIDLPLPAIPVQRPAAPPAQPLPAKNKVAAP